MTTPAPAAPTDYPGKTLGIVALVLAFVFTLLGLILGIVANNQSKAAGVKNTPAKVAIILSVIFIVGGILIAIIAGVTGGLAVSGSVGSY
jgi:preprotein translocase subunit SecG